MSNHYRHNVYWNGRFQARLSPSQVSVSWGAPGARPVNRSIEFVNRAFEIYYLAKNNISDVSDHDHRTSMSLQLLDAARSGYGFGVSDLEEALVHLVSNSGRWVDEDSSQYNGGGKKAFGGGLVRGPTSIVNFMCSIDDKMINLKDCVSDFGLRKQSLLSSYVEIGRQNAGPTPAESWTQFGTAMNELKTWGGHAKPFLWLAPATQTLVGNTVSFVNVISQIHTGLTTYGNCMRAGIPTNSSIALSAAGAAMTWVPVLGGFYGKAIEMIPGMKLHFEHIMSDYQRRIEVETGMSAPIIL